MREALALLRREKDFRRVYVAGLVQLGGDWFVLVPLLTLLSRLTGGGLYGGLVLAADTVALAALSPWAGTIVDRVDRRRIVVVANAACAVGVLLLLTVRSAATAPVALVVVAGIAAAKAFSTPASSAALPNLVPAGDLPAASVLAGASWGVMLTLGGAAGGALAAVAGEGACVAVSCVAYALAAMTVARTTRPFSAATEPRARTSFTADVRETVAYARAHPRVAALLAVKSGVGVGNGVIALFPLLAVVYGAGPLAVGVLFSARGLGALIGPLALRRRATDPARLPGLLAVSMLSYGLCYGVLGWVGVLPVAVVLVVVAHVGGGANWVLSVFALQAAVPDRLRGRVFAADLMVATLAVGMSQLLAGLLSDLVDTRVLLSCFGGATFLYGLGWYAVVRRLPAGVPVEADVPVEDGVPAEDGSPAPGASPAPAARTGPTLTEAA